MSLLSSKICFLCPLSVHGGHLWFVTNTDVGQFSTLLHLVAGPHKCKYSRNNCAAVLHTIRNNKRFLTKPELWPPSWTPARRRVECCRKLHHWNPCPENTGVDTGIVFVTSDSWGTRGWGTTLHPSSLVTSALAFLRWNYAPIHHRLL